MRKEEKKLLKELVESNEGLLSTQVFTEGYKRKIAQGLIVSDFVEEFQYKHISCYRATKKGRMIFKPFHERLWFSIKGDFRIIMVAAITALIVSVISKIISR